MEIQAIKKYMKDKHITYDELAERSKLSISTIKKIFSGISQYPRIDTMQAIEAALGLSYEKLEITESDKNAGVELKHREILSPDEMEVVDTYRAIKSEKGEGAAQAIKKIMLVFLDEKTKNSEN